METTTVSGTVEAPAVDLSHTSPTNITINNPKGAGDFNSGVSGWQNTGNVAQTVDISAVNATNCTVTSLVFGGGGTSKTLQPGESASANYTVNLPALAPGAPNEPFSFDIDSDWNEA